MTVSPEKIAEMLQEAIDLLAERRYGNSARSPGHNARLLLESVLPQLSGITEETSSWQPIETAPKDGTTVDLYGARGLTPRRFTDARWMEIHMMGTGDPTGEYRWFFPAWDMYGEFEFTHWREVPPNPVAGSLS